MSSLLEPSPEIEALNTAWASWWPFIMAHQPWTERGGPICERLRLFQVEHSVSDVERVLARLSQGKHLVQAALQWTMPVTGSCPPFEAGPTDRARGEQWRLVMAYAGLERVHKTLLRLDGQACLDGDSVRRFVVCCGLSDYVELAPPPFHRRRPKPAACRMRDLPEFKGVLKGWLDGHAIRSWSEAIQLAQGLRHATAHGTLSAARTDRMGMRPAFRRLTLDVGVAVTAALNRMLV